MLSFFFGNPVCKARTLHNDYACYIMTFRIKYHKSQELADMYVICIFRATVAVLWDVMPKTETLPRLALCLGGPTISVPTEFKFTPGSQSMLNG